MGSLKSKPDSMSRGQEWTTLSKVASRLDVITVRPVLSFERAVILEMVEAEARFWCHGEQLNHEKVVTETVSGCLPVSGKTRIWEMNCNTGYGENLFLFNMEET